VNESGVLELRWGRTIGQKMAAVLGTLCSSPPSKSKKVKQSCYMPLKALGGGGGIAPTHSHLGTRWGRVVVMHRPRFTPGEGTPVPIG
jgi:hypothetical protein